MSKVDLTKYLIKIDKQESTKNSKRETKESDEFKQLIKKLKSEWTSS